MYRPLPPRHLPSRYCTRTASRRHCGTCRHVTDQNCQQATLRHSHCNAPQQQNKSAVAASQSTPRSYPRPDPVSVPSQPTPRPRPRPRPAPVPSRPVPSRPAPSRPVPSRPIPSRPVPSRQHRPAVVPGHVLVHTLSSVWFIGMILAVTAGNSASVTTKTRHTESAYHLICNRAGIGGR